MLLFYGLAHPLTTTIFYVWLTILFLLAEYVVANTTRYNNSLNVRVFIVTASISLLAGDLILRYGLKIHLVYSEKFGKEYVSPYTYMSDWNSIKRYWFDKSDYWHLVEKPNAVDSFTVDKRGFQIIHNSLGFRDAEVQSHPDDPQHLVIGLGDSFAEGIGADGDSTWIRSMARYLNTDTNRHVRTFNAGIAGSDVFFEYVVLEKLLEQYKPNTVVLGINSSDIDDIIIKGGRNRFKPGGGLQFNSPPWWEPLYASSFIFRAAIHGTRNYDWTLLTFKQKAIKQKEALDSIETSVYRFSKLAKQKGFNLVVVFHPREEEILSGNFPYDSLTAKLALDTTLHIINMQQEFTRTGLITKQNSANYYWKTDLHHNAAGYNVMGSIIATYIRNNGLLCKNQ